ncbi:flavin reductase family protein [Kistimonas asteriae]|uniref:flavin reductase family protein n=1 Tax=Kistimonas asteriae TaxID=517724 RepID=UPI001BA5A98E|nr:iron-sulfur cluster-binding domain-containing protein [Kistimonas asteriae]
MQLTCVGIQQETADVVSFLFLADQPVDFIPGQFISLMVSIEGQTASRAYSISSLPGDSRLRLTIKRVPVGRVSNYLLDTIRIGDRLEALSPAGEFHSQAAGNNPWLLLAAGCGVTPLFSMLKARLAEQFDADICLLCSVRSELDRIFFRELTQLAAHYPNFRLHWLDDSAGECLDMTSLAALVDDVAERSVMICGPQGYMDAARDMVTRSGANNVHTEAFQPPEREQVVSGNNGFTLSVGDMRLPIAEGQTVLESLEQGGVPILAACRSGICGSCKCQGEAERVERLSTVGLSAEEIEQGYFLACSARAIGDMTVVVNR